MTEKRGHGHVDRDAFSALNHEFIEELYETWKKDGASVDPEWAALFTELETEGHRVPGAFTPGPPPPSSIPRPEQGNAELAHKQSRFDSLLWSYRDVGYLYARLNPLVGYLSADLHFLFDQEENLYERLTLKEFGLGEADLDLVLTAGRYLKPQRAALREHLKALQEIYCSTIGIEFLHIQNRKMRNWIIEKVESGHNRPDLTDELRMRILKDLARAEEFEQFLHTQFIGQKRFSLEGSEVLIPALHHLVDEAVDLGVEDIVLGMSHRGRLNVLANVMDKPAVEIFFEFEDVLDPELYGGSGDVKYHKGYLCDHVNTDGRRIRINLVSNPSHLEAVDPVVEGVARGLQRVKGDGERKRVIPVLVHGDAAFAGQGVVPETLNLSRLRGYGTGGTVHFVVNNQIGFTTSTKDARSTFFPTDVAKMLPIPIFHANGDDPEAVVHVTDLALRYRQEFARDVIVDIFCYRRHGHNEGDEPSFTHPKMYHLIRYHQSTAKKYGDQLEALGIMTLQEQAGFAGEYKKVLKEELERSRSGATHGGHRKAGVPAKSSTSRKTSTPGQDAGLTEARADTSVPQRLLQDIVKKISTVPAGFNIQPKLERIVKEREAKFTQENRIDFALAEALAFGSLLLEGTHIRLSGEDSARGTFAQRHSVWWDRLSSRPLPYTPLNAIAEGQACFSVYDSPLSEFSVLGFEYGFTLAMPEALVLWEAQFGDFSNGAQVVIDNFIVSGESKWGSGSGIVMLLPHGYEGQGPEHSSAHLERFLQLCAQDDIRVCNVTTPAQYFHLLRRQARVFPRKPLVLMTPKSLLRHPLAVSPLEALTAGGFSEIVEDSPAGTPPGDGDGESICFCSGKICYELRGVKPKSGSSAVRIVRVEQLYPFPEGKIMAVIAKYPNARELIWAQEEPMNRGAWTFVKDRLARLSEGRVLRYAGRSESASTATGSHNRHALEQQSIIAEVFDKRNPVPRRRSDALSDGHLSDGVRDGSIAKKNRSSHGT